MGGWVGGWVEEEEEEEDDDDACREGRGGEVRGGGEGWGGVRGGGVRGRRGEREKVRREEGGGWGRNYCPLSYNVAPKYVAPPKLHCDT